MWCFLQSSLRLDCRKQDVAAQRQISRQNVCRNLSYRKDPSEQREHSFFWFAESIHKCSLDHFGRGGWAQSACYLPYRELPHNLNNCQSFDWLCDSCENGSRSARTTQQQAVNYCVAREASECESDFHRFRKQRHCSSLLFLLETRLALVNLLLVLSTQCQQLYPWKRGTNQRCHQRHPYERPISKQSHRRRQSDQHKS